MSIALLHLRTNPVRWAVPPLLLIDLAVIFFRNRHWVGVWPESGAAGQVSAYVLGPLVAGAAAWAAAAPQRHGLTELLSAAHRRPLAIEGYRFGSTATLLSVPYIAGQMATFALTAKTFPPGFALWLGYALLGLSFSFLAIGVGWVIGSVFRSIFAAMLAMLGFLALLAFLIQQPDLLIISGRPEMEVGAVVLIQRFSLLLLLAGAILIMRNKVGVVGPRKSLIAISCLLGVILHAGLAQVTYFRQPPGDAVMCTQGSTKLCLWPEHEKYLAQVQSVADRVGELPEVFIRPALINQYGIDEEVRPRELNGRKQYPAAALTSETYFFYITEGSPWSVAGNVAESISSLTFKFTDRTSCAWGEATDQDESRLDSLDAWLESYLVGGGMPDYSTNAPAETQAAWAVGRDVAADSSLEQQFEWAEREVNDLRGKYC